MTCFCWSGIHRNGQGKSTVKQPPLGTEDQGCQLCPAHQHGHVTLADPNQLLMHWLEQVGSWMVLPVGCS